MCRSSRGRNTSSKPPEKNGEFNIQSVTDKAEKSESSDEDSYVFTVPPPVEKKGTETASKVKTIPVVVEKTNIRISPVGLGAILSQFDINCNERIVAYASRNLIVFCLLFIYTSHCFCELPQNFKILSVNTKICQKLYFFGFHP